MLTLLGYFTQFIADEYLPCLWNLRTTIKCMPSCVKIIYIGYCNQSKFICHVHTNYTLFIIRIDSHKIMAMFKTDAVQNYPVLDRERTKTKPVQLHNSTVGCIRELVPPGETLSGNN